MGYTALLYKMLMITLMLRITIKYAGDGTSLKEKVMNKTSFLKKMSNWCAKLFLEAFISGPMHLVLGNTFFGGGLLCGI